MKLLGVVLIAALGAWAAPGLGQNMAGKQATMGYRYGVGRITWTFPEGLAANFAVPHWTAGARVQCGGKSFRCEIQVSARDISISDEERMRQLGEAARPLLAQSKDQSLDFKRGDSGVVYLTLEDPRPGKDFRFLMVGYAHKGPALLKFELTANDPADIGPVLALVNAAKPIDALEMWALRLGDYRAVCEERFPAYKEANDRAFAGSPFAAVDMLRLFLKDDPALTEEAARKRLSEVRNGFAADFDRDPSERRQAFCEGFPKWVAEAAQGL